MKKSIKEFTIYRKNLPHWQIPGSVYFVTFRTCKKLILDEISKKLLYDNILHYSTKYYKLYCFVIMPDHVHLIIQPKEVTQNEYYPLSRIMQAIKGYSAKRIKYHLINKSIANEENIKLRSKIRKNEILDNEIPKHIFQSESFDRIIRDEAELQEKMNYIMNNPVKWDLIENGYEYKWFFVSNDL
jgi:REP element-mobilizing transposase RayT